MLATLAPARCCAGWVARLDDSAAASITVAASVMARTNSMSGSSGFRSVMFGAVNSVSPGLPRLKVTPVHAGIRSVHASPAQAR